jgi:formylglycine-generating enzyme required for sulfatase activity
MSPPQVTSICCIPYSRGGSWYGAPDSCGPAGRGGTPPDDQHRSFGLRVVVD